MSKIVFVHGDAKSLVILFSIGDFISYEFFFNYYFVYYLFYYFYLKQYVECKMCLLQKTETFHNF